MWRCPFDFSYLEKQEQEQQASTFQQQYGSTNPDQGLLYNPSAPFWYVLLLLDNNKAGHTCVIKSTRPEAYDHPGRRLQSASGVPLPPVKEHAWHLALAIVVGNNEAEADLIIDRISTSNNGKKQVRGGMQRGIRGNLVSTWRKKSVYADHSALLGITEKQFTEQVKLMGYVLSTGM